MPALSTARVLTVEDDPIVRADLRLILEDAGFDVCPDARDGLEAVELAREHRPDLILMDLSLPGIDGVEATRRILDERDVPIVALTGHSRRAGVERAIEAGAIAHVLKPFHDTHLVETLTGALADHAAREQTDPGLDAETEAERYHQLALIETMLRNGYNEAEITAALNGYAYEPLGVVLIRRLSAKLARWL
jgi:response regulator NasT